MDFSSSISQTQIIQLNFRKVEIVAIKIEMLRYFCTVAQTGNLAEAAERLGRTPSAVSMKLKQLESHLGHNLFENERKNQLSLLGEQVFELSLNQIRQFDRTVQNIESVAESRHGSIRIFSVPSVAELIFPSVLEHMISNYPGLKIELHDTNTQQVLDAISEGKADIGIASGYHPLNSVRAVALFQDRFGLICASHHSLMTREDLPSILDIDPEQFVRNDLCHLIRTPDFLRLIKNAQVTIHNVHSLIAMVRTGCWVTVLPQLVAQFIPETTAFRPFCDLPDKREVYLYIRERLRFKDMTEECCRFILRQKLTAGGEGQENEKQEDAP